MTVEQKAEEYYYKKVFANTNPQNEKELKERFLQTFKDGYRECEKEWQKKADYLKGKKEMNYV